MTAPDPGPQSTSIYEPGSPGLPHQASCMQHTFDWLYASAHTGSSRPVFGCPLLLRFVCILPFNQSMWALRCIGRAWLARYARFPRSWRAWLELYGCMTGTWLKRLIREPNNSKLHPLSLANEDAVNQTAPLEAVGRRGGGFIAMGYHMVLRTFLPSTIFLCTFLLFFLDINTLTVLKIVSRCHLDP